jgi:hypothetical protein
MNLFEQAVRSKFRFQTPQGQITAEDLFDLPLTSRTGRANLDDIAKGLHRELKASDEQVSFVTETKSNTDGLQAKFDLVKQVIQNKVEEKQALEASAERAEKRQRLLALIAQKEDQALAETSLDDLRKMVEAM